MAPQPKRRISSYRRGKRRSANWRIDLPQLVKCSNPACQKMARPHQACGYCGFYKGEKV